MNYFENAAKTVGRYAEKAGKKAGEMTNRAKIRFALANLQDDLDELYAKLGEIRYETLTTGHDNASREHAAVTKISAIKADMEILKEELRATDSTAVCPTCKKKLSKNSEFCPYCGNKL